MTLVWTVGHSLITWTQNKRAIIRVHEYLNAIKCVWNFNAKFIIKSSANCQTSVQREGRRCGTTHFGRVCSCYEDSDWSRSQWACSAEVKISNTSRTVFNLQTRFELEPGRLFVPFLNQRWHTLHRHVADAVWYLDLSIGLLPVSEQYLFTICAIATASITAQQRTWTSILHAYWSNT